MMRLIYTLQLLGFISKTFGSLKITPSAGADPGFVLGGGALVSCSASTPINHIVFFFLQNASCIRKPQVISGRGGALPLHPPPRSAPALSLLFNIKTISCLTVPRIYPFQLKFRMGLLCQIGYCGTRPAERYKIATDRKCGLVRSMAEPPAPPPPPAITSDWMRYFYPSLRYVVTRILCAKHKNTSP